MTEEVDIPINRIRLSIQECIEVEVETSQLSFDELEVRALKLLEVVSKKVHRSEINVNETA